VDKRDKREGGVGKRRSEKVSLSGEEGREGYIYIHIYIYIVDKTRIWQVHAAAGRIRCRRWSGAI
jgi:hypothetical protein